MTLSSETLFPDAPKFVLKALDAAIAAQDADNRMPEHAKSEAKNAPADPLETPKSLNFKEPDGTPTLSLRLREQSERNEGNAGDSETIDKESIFSVSSFEAPLQSPPRPEAGRTGKDPVNGCWRLPNADEHIRDDNIVWPDAMWIPSAPKNRKRKLAPLETLPDVQRELAKLYADYHHRRIEAGAFTRGVYGLTSLATVIKMEQKFDHAYAAKLREAIRS